MRGESPPSSVSAADASDGGRSRRRLYRWLLALLPILAAVSLWNAPAIRGRLLLRLAQQVTPDGGCEAGLLARWSALQQGAQVSCLGRLDADKTGRWMLVRVATRRSAPIPARTQALAALTARRDPSVSELVRSLVLAAGTAPDLRRSFWSIGSSLDPLAQASVAGSVALHGLWARGEALRFAEGEADALPMLHATRLPDPWVEQRLWAGLGVSPAEMHDACAARAEGRTPRALPREWLIALTAAACDPGDPGAPLILLRRVLDAEGHRRGEDHTSPPDLPLSDAALDLLLYRDGAAGDQLRASIAAVRSWVQSGAVLPRLQAAVAHPQAATRADPGDLLATLHHGSGSPAAAAALTAWIGSGLARPPTLHLSRGGVEVRLPPDPARDDPAPLSAFTLGAACPDAVPLPPEGAIALALAERMGRSLRAGDWEAAIAQGEAAGALWDGSPARLARLIARSLTPLSLAPLPLAPETSLLFPRLPPAPVRLPRRGRRFPPVADADLPAPPPDALADHRAISARSLDLLALTPDPADLAFAALWVARRPGGTDLASHLLPPLTGSPGPAWQAAARLLGEPFSAIAAAQPQECATPFWEAFFLDGL